MMRRALTIALLCGTLAACEVPSPFQYKVPNLGAVAPPGDLAADRAACDKAHPRRIGGYVAHTECVNAAIEKNSIPLARYPDLIRLQEQLRLKYSTAIDQGAMSPAAAEAKMKSADDLVAATMHDRDVGRKTVAEHRLTALQAMLQ